MAAQVPQNVADFIMKPRPKKTLNETLEGVNEKFKDFNIDPYLDQAQKIAENITSKRPIKTKLNII